MKLTQASDYAFRAVLFLARKEGQIVEAQTISDRQQIPKRFLLKICRELGQAGIIDSFRGKRGGYKLGRPASEITLKDVIEAVEGDLVINKCQKGTDYCNRNAADTCVLHHSLNSIRDLMAAELAKYDFERLVNMNIE